MDTNSLRIGMEVKFFHPYALGVIAKGKITTIGRRTVRCTNIRLSGGARISGSVKVSKSDIVEILTLSFPGREN